MSQNLTENVGCRLKSNSLAVPNQSVVSLIVFIDSQLNCAGIKGKGSFRNCAESTYFCGHNITMDKRARTVAVQAG